VTTGAGETTFRFSIDLPVRNEWQNIDLIRTSVQNCFTAVFSDLDECRALSMVTGELLENAMKYGHWSRAGAPQHFRLRVQNEGGKLQVIVENPIAPDDPSVERLLGTLRKIESFPSAEAAYRARMLEIASASDELETSRLGLVRVAYEGGCRLSARIDGGTLTMIAEMSL
jgi:hypothetical protein